MIDPPIPFVGLDRQHARLRDDLRSAFDRVADSSAFILGDEVERFEEEFASFCGTADCVGVASGTAALSLALEALGIGAGDEVILPAHTFVATALAVVRVGATPVYADVHASTGLLDAASVAERVTARTAAVMAVHLYGASCDMDTIDSIASARGLAVIEDAAQAHGATYARRTVGSLGRVSTFSFYPSKNLGALGDGGAVCTSDPEVSRRVRELRNIGQRAKNEHLVVGVNERLDGLQAAFLRVKLPFLSGWNEARRGHAARYASLLGDSVVLPAEREDAPSVHHVFAIRVPDRDAVAAQLAWRGIHTAVHYPRTVPQQEAYRDPEAERGTPCASAWAAEELSLPMFPELKAGEIERVAVAVREAVGL